MNKIPVERMVPNNEWLKQQHIPLYRLVLPYIKDKTILDAGCGCCMGGAIWIDHGARIIFAYDISDEALEYCKKISNIVLNKIDFNYDRLPHQDFFDVACSIEVIEHIKNYEFYKIYIIV